LEPPKFIPKCKDCDKLAEWYVWYKDTSLVIGGGNIAYNSLCDEHAQKDLREGREGYVVEYMRKIGE
jgi:hypothetical protein